VYVGEKISHAFSKTTGRQYRRESISGVLSKIERAENISSSHTMEKSEKVDIFHAAFFYNFSLGEIITL
jgi:hypothetical protein